MLMFCTVYVFFMYTCVKCVLFKEEIVEIIFGRNILCDNDFNRILKFIINYKTNICFFHKFKLLYNIFT